MNSSRDEENGYFSDDDDFSLIGIFKPPQQWKGGTPEKPKDSKFLSTTKGKLILLGAVCLLVVCLTTALTAASAKDKNSKSNSSLEGSIVKSAEQNLLLSPTLSPSNAPTAATSSESLSNSPSSSGSGTTMPVLPTIQPTIQSTGTPTVGATAAGTSVSSTEATDTLSTDTPSPSSMGVPTSVPSSIPTTAYPSSPPTRPPSSFLRTSSAPTEVPTGAPTELPTLETMLPTPSPTTLLPTSLPTTTTTTMQPTTEATTEEKADDCSKNHTLLATRMSDDLYEDLCDLYHCSGNDDNDTANANDNNDNATFTVALQDMDRSESILFTRLHLQISNGSCQQHLLNDGTPPPVVSTSVVHNDDTSTEEYLLEGSVSGLTMDCEMDYEWSYGFLHGTGTAKLTVEDTNVAASWKTATSNEEMEPTPISCSATTTASEAGVKLDGITFADQFLRNALDNMLWESVEAQIGELLCDEMTTVGSTALEESSILSDTRQRQEHRLC